ncbi:DUF397 domain-containing protein [Streptomyces sp. NPDC047525]|uniref:DUF397 domain-containing protein n=1 Tax=Streptomyces sp. NPDC047525 TaxID=3155264 RepID=UPI003410B7A1
MQTWKKSSYSGDSGSCLEFCVSACGAGATTIVMLRDSKVKETAEVTLRALSRSAFIGSLKCSGIACAAH